MSNSPLHKNPCVLVAPLDWGLGHATRCIPIIRQLLKANCTVIIGAEGKTKALLQAEFQQLTFLHLDGYKISYGSNKWGLILKIILQLPKLINAIRKENKWLKGIIKEYNIDAVISDNRYGLNHPDIFSVFITHQLTIKSSLGRASEKMLQRINYSFINRFKECWVPDIAIKESLAGELSHPEKEPAIPVHYIGTLTRFHFTDENTNGNYLLILLSGPEPQRTLLERLLLQQLKNYHKPVLFVRGLPGEVEISGITENIKFTNHLPATELEKAIVQAAWVIGRCGYSTVMDLMELRKKSILIPTPGQTEQEYLAVHLMQQQYAFCMNQAHFNLADALDAASNFSYKVFTTNSSIELNKRIEELVNAMLAKSS